MDGSFEGPPAWDLEFHEYAWREELKRLSLEQGREVGALLFGRAMYDGMAAHWTTARARSPTSWTRCRSTCSPARSRAPTGTTPRSWRATPAEAVTGLKEQPGKNLFVFGSADLSATLFRHRLFDEYRIGLVRVTMGEGNLPFERDSEPLRLELLQSRPLGLRCLLLPYQPAAVAAAAR